MLVSMVVRPATSPLAISFLFFVSRVQSATHIYFYVENVLRATQTRVISHPAVASLHFVAFDNPFCTFSKKLDKVKNNGVDRALAGACPTISSASEKGKRERCHR